MIVMNENAELNADILNGVMTLHGPLPNFCKSMYSWKTALPIRCKMESLSCEAPERLFD